MVKVLLDARKLGDGGIGVYLENLIEGFLPIIRSGVLALTLIIDPKRRAEQSIERLLSKISPDVNLIEDSASCYSISEYFLMPLRIRKVLRDIDIFHSPHYTLPFFLKCKRVVTIHDIIHFTHPDTKSHNSLGQRLIQSAISRADEVITVSNHSKQQLLSKFKIEEKKLSVIHNGLRAGIQRVSPEVSSNLVNSLGITGPFALFVGSARPHKGLHSLLVALSILKHSLEQDDKEPLRLVVVGEVTTSLQHEMKALGLEGEVTCLASQELEALNALYSVAIVTVIASLEEGFGLVALESLAVGCPVVSTPLASVKEIAQDAVFFAEGFAPKDIFYAIKDLLSSEQSLVKQKVEKGQALVKEFSIEAAANKTFALYKNIKVAEGRC